MKTYNRKLTQLWKSLHNFNPRCTRHGLFTTALRPVDILLHGAQSAEIFFKEAPPCIKLAPYSAPPVMTLYDFIGFYVFKFLWGQSWFSHDNCRDFTLFQQIHCLLSVNTSCEGLICWDSEKINTLFTRCFWIGNPPHPRRRSSPLCSVMPSESSRKKPRPVKNYGTQPGTPCISDFNSVLKTLQDCWVL